MGGGSTQLIFYDHIPGMTEVLEESHFWSHSWLNYGVETVRDRVYRYLYDNNLDAEKVDGKVYLNNPCGNKNSMYDYDEETVLVGTGNSTECVTAIEKLLWPNEKCQVEEACAIDGIVHPSVRGQHFYAMSVYYFAFDCIRHLGPVDIVNW